jgi:Mg2+-importing ATPase
MMVFGLVSSVCDYLTFGVLLFFLHATERQFRTGWFVESVISASLIVLVIRTRKPFYRSRPGRYLLFATLATIVVTLLLPYTPLARLFGFTPITPLFLLALALILASYIAIAEVAKVFFYRHERQ